MSEQPFQAPPVQDCYRHPGVQTGVHCTRCGRPICPDCMIPAPVGYQCPNCVQEARQADRASGGGPQQVRSMSGTPMTFALIAIMVVIYAAGVLAGGPFDSLNAKFANFGAAQSYLISQGDYYRLGTSMFLHLGFFHLLINSFSLYFIGGFIERMLGRAALIVMFLVTGLAASAVAYALSPLTIQGLTTPSVGASGGIAGLFGVFFVYVYRRRNTQMGRSLLTQAIVLLVLNIYFSAQPGIGWQAHLGGFLAGLAAGFAFEELRERMKVRNALAVVSVVLLAATVALCVWKTGQINAAIPTLFGALN